MGKVFIDKNSLCIILMYVFIAYRNPEHQESHALTSVKKVSSCRTFLLEEVFYLIMFRYLSIYSSVNNLRFTGSKPTLYAIDIAIEN